MWYRSPLITNFITTYTDVRIYQSQIALQSILHCHTRNDYKKFWSAFVPVRYYFDMNHPQENLEVKAW